MKVFVVLALLCLPCFAEQHGLASFYSVKSNRGTRTASGQPLSDKKPSAAHRSLPFGTMIRVTSIKTGKAVELPVTDRGPFVKGRVVDLSVAAAKAIGLTSKVGVTRVRVEVINYTAKK